MIVSIASLVGLIILVAMITLWAARGRPLWGGIALLVWFIANLVFSAGIDDTPSMWAYYRFVIIVSLTFLLAFALNSVREIEIKAARAARAR